MATEAGDIVAEHLDRAQQFLVDAEGMKSPFPIVSRYFYAWEQWKAAKRCDANLDSVSRLGQMLSEKIISSASAMVAAVDAEAQAKVSRARSRERQAKVATLARDDLMQLLNLSGDFPEIRAQLAGLVDDWTAQVSLLSI